MLQAAAEQYAESAAWRAWTAVKETATQEFDKITEVWRPGFRKLATTLTKTMTALALPDLDERHMAQVLSQGGRAAAAWNEAHEAAAQLEMVGLAWMALAEFVGREAEAAQNWNLYGMPRERMVKVKYLPLWGVDAPTETWDAAVRAANKANRRVGVDELAGAGATLKLATWAEYEARARDYIYPPTEDTKDVA
ncbi:MAG: hypothetical protein FWD29_03365 [Micrococcales bacterium]|nr:hypothetical protein [Micrococcales bacterium]